MKLLINLGEENSTWLRSSRIAGLVLKPLLEALTMADQVFLKLHPDVPPLYQAGVHYDNEPSDFLCHIDGKTERVEDFASVPTILKRGWGDCDDLAPWRCAELRNSGEKASIRIQWKTYAQRMSQMALGRPFKLYHIVVRRQDGSVEDPSKILGMP